MSTDDDTDLVTLEPMDLVRAREEEYLRSEGLTRADYDRITAALEAIRTDQLVPALEPKAPYPCADCGEPAETSTMRFTMLCNACAAARAAERMRAPSSPMPGTVESALARSRRRRLPATLTVEEWIATVEHFYDRCAYCGGPWDVVSHATALTFGGGTTMDNCLPACNECLKQKRDHTTEELRGRSAFDRDRLEVAIAWLVANGRPITRGTR